MPEGTPLEMWLKRHAADSMSKYELLETFGFNRPLVFQTENNKHSFEAFIDPEDRFDIRDKLSQVRDESSTCHCSGVGDSIEVKVKISII